MENEQLYNNGKNDGYNYVVQSDVIYYDYYSQVEPLIDDIIDQADYIPFHKATWEDPAYGGYWENNVTSIPHDELKKITLNIINKEKNEIIKDYANFNNEIYYKGFVEGFMRGVNDDILRLVEELLEEKEPPNQDDYIDPDDY